MASGYPTPDEPVGDVEFTCIPVTVPDLIEFKAAIYGLYSSMSRPYFWRATGTMSPETAAELAARGLAETDAYSSCSEAQEDECIEYLSNNAIIDYQPMNPFVNPGDVPGGYLLPPFARYADLLFEDLPDWLADLVAEITGEFTGYEPNDVLSLIGSFPLDITNWFEALTNGLPRFTIEVSGAGVIELHMLSVPFGGKALVTVDVEPNIEDIFGGIIAGNVNIIELERDITSVPPELNAEVIHEIEVVGSGDHVIHVTFVPNINDALLPVGFGGGIRSAVWCANEIPDEPCEDCPEPTIEELLADNEFFVDEYVPATFGEYYSATAAEQTSLEAAYDGSTPQSIGADIPTGEPDLEEQNALCYVTTRFVELYSSTKLCLIQSKNFAEILWTKLAGAANEFYNAASSIMAFVYTPDLFSCFVDDAEAITALQDTAAIEELACHLYDELRTVTISQANFDAAILDAATTLTGNAGKIACIMQNDNNQALYLQFLQGYQIALDKVQSGETLDCPCEPGGYQLWTWDFANGLGDFQIIYGSLSGGFMVGADIGTQHRVELRMNWLPSWRVRSVRWYEYREGAITHGSLDSSAIRLRPNPTLDTGGYAFFGGGFLPDGALTRCFNWTSTAYYDGANEFHFAANVRDDNVAPNSLYRLSKIEVSFVRGYAKGGYIHDDNNLCD